MGLQVTLRLSEQIFDAPATRSIPLFLTRLQPLFLFRPREAFCLFLCSLNDFV